MKKLSIRNNIIPVPNGWRRLRLGEGIPSINKYQSGNRWLDGWTGYKGLIRINKGYVRYIVPIDSFKEKQPINFVNPT